MKNTQLPYISAILPVFNAEQYLAQAIESILNQTFTNYELIIIDDGSTDRSYKIAKKYAEKDSRVKFLVQDNMGISKTLNRGIELAQGEWIARMDADDIALPDRFEKQIAKLCVSGADICGSWIEHFGSYDTRIIKYRESDQAIKYEMLFGTPFAHPTIMMRADLANTLRYDDKWDKCEDYDLWERAVRAGYKMTNVQEVLLKYRVHNLQSSLVASQIQQEMTQKVRLRYGVDFFESKGIDSKLFEEILKIRSSESLPINIKLVEKAFDRLLELAEDECRFVVFDHVTRLYHRLATHSTSAGASWSRLNKKYGHQRSFRLRFVFYLLRFFDVNMSNGFFKLLKVWYMKTFN